MTQLYHAVKHVFYISPILVNRRCTASQTELFATDVVMFDHSRLNRFISTVT